jgi:hypothetical protein
MVELAEKQPLRPEAASIAPGEHHQRDGPAMPLTMPATTAVSRPETAMSADDLLQIGRNAWPEIRRSRLLCIVGLLRRVPKMGGSYHDPLFERPGQVEDDYRRFRNQPYGW